MKDRPILFNAPMVRALLDGSKTQTRRICKTRKDRHFGCDIAPHEIAGEVNAGNYTNCPYGQPGDRLWVRETFAAHFMYDDLPPTMARSQREDLRPTDNRWFAAEGDGSPSQILTPPHGLRGKWRPSIHMPRWASRFTLEITSVRVERLQDISASDAIAEGTIPMTGDDYDTNFINGYRLLWESINGPNSWAANTWVWAIEFRRVT